MKLNPITWNTTDDGATIAQYGSARLVKKLDGTRELLGGTPDDTKEWCSIFAPDLFFDSPWRIDQPLLARTRA